MIHVVDIWVYCSCLATTKRKTREMQTAERQNIKSKRSVAEFAAEWGVSRMTVYRLISSGKLDAIRVGNQWRIPADAVLK